MRKKGFALHRKEKRVLPVMLAINLVSITLLSLFNYLVFHSANTKAYLESFISYNQSVVDLAFENINSQIMESIYHIPQLYFAPMGQNTAILLPQSKDITQSPSDILALTTGMNEIQKSYPYVDSLDIYYEGTHTVVTGFNKIHFTENREEVEKYLPWYSQYLEQGQDRLFLELGRFSYPVSEEYLTYVKKLPRLSGGKSDILVAIHISPRGFYGYLDLNKGNFLILDPDQRVIYESKETGQAYGEEIKVRREGAANTIKGRGSFAFESQHGPVTAFYSYSGSTGLTYYYCVRNDTFYSDYNLKNKAFVWNFIFSVVFNILVLALISYVNYTTYIKQVRFFSEKAGMAEEPGRKGLEDSLSAMTDTITNLSETVRSSESLLFQNEVRSLILNRRLEKSCGRVELYLVFNSIRTVLIHVSDQQFDAISIDSLQKQFNRPEEPFRALFTTMEKGEVAAVLNFDQDTQAEAEERFEGLLDEAFHGCPAVWGQVCERKLENLKHSYKNACELARYRFIFTEEKKLTYEGVNMEQRKNSGSHLKLFAAIEKDLNSESLLDFKYHSAALVASFQNGNYTIDYCISTLRDLVTIFYQTIQNSRLDMWVIVGYDIREYYKQIRDIEAFHQWIDGLCEVVLGNIRQKKKNVDVDLKDKLLRLIEENLEKDISLELLADQVDMRLDTLSRSFRQTMGKGYTEYVKERKLARALELMDEELSIKEVARRLGYNSPQYFIKIFKETFGETPYQYKKNKKGGEEYGEEEE